MPFRCWHWLLLWVPGKSSRTTAATRAHGHLQAGVGSHWEASAPWRLVPVGHHDQRLCHHGCLSVPWSLLARGTHTCWCVGNTVSAALQYCWVSLHLCYSFVISLACQFCIFCMWQWIFYFIHPWYLHRRVTNIVPYLMAYKAHKCMQCTSSLVCCFWNNLKTMVSSDICCSPYPKSHFQVSQVLRC